MTNHLPRPLRLGVIGAGGIAKSSHLPALAILQLRGWPVSVVAIADPAPERITSALRLLVPSQAANPASCRIYSGGAELLAAGDVDAVLVLTPPAHTAPLLENALKRGIPVLAEKPGATNAETFARLLQAEKAAVNPLARIAYNRHALPLVPAFLVLLHEMRERAAHPHTLHVEARLWRTNRDTPIFYDDTMVHALDFLNWCVGPLLVERVEWWPASTTNGLRTGLRVALRSEGGNGNLPPLTAHLDVRPAVGRDVESYEVLGNRESLTLVYPSPDDKTAQADLIRYENRRSFFLPASILAAEAGDTTDDPDGLAARGFLPQLVHFLQLAAGDANAGRQLCTITQAHQTMVLKEKILSGFTDH